MPLSYQESAFLLHRFVRRCFRKNVFSYEERICCESSHPRSCYKKRTLLYSTGIANLIVGTLLSRRVRSRISGDDQCNAVSSQLHSYFSVLIYAHKGVRPTIRFGCATSGNATFDDMAPTKTSSINRNPILLMWLSFGG
jgi:hypothetical protein